MMYLFDPLSPLLGAIVLHPMYPMLWILEILQKNNLIPEIINNKNLLYFVGPYYLFWSGICYLIKKFFKNKDTMNIFYLIIFFYVSLYPIFFIFGFIMTTYVNFFMLIM